MNSKVLSCRRGARAWRTAAQPVGRLGHRPEEHDSYVTVKFGPYFPTATNALDAIGNGPEFPTK